MLSRLRFLTFFYVFWKIQKTWLFTFFCLASHVFSNYDPKFPNADRLPTMAERQK